MINVKSVILGEHSLLTAHCYCRASAPTFETQRYLYVLLTVIYWRLSVQASAFVTLRTQRMQCYKEFLVTFRDSHSSLLIAHCSLLIATAERLPRLLKRRGICMCCSS